MRKIKGLCHSKYNGDNIFHRNLRPVHDQCHFRNGNVPHPTGHGHIRPTGLPVIRDKVFDGHFRTVFQPGGKIGETAVQFCGLLRVQFAPFSGLPGSFPYCRLVARQRGKRHGRKYGYYLCSTAIKDPSHQCPLRKIPCSELEKLVLKQIVDIFKPPSILRATLAAVHEREVNLRHCYEQDIERLTGRLIELRKEALNENADFDEIKRVAEMLTSIRKKVKALAAPVAEEEVIKALNDVNGLWEFMFPGTKSELLRMMLGKIIVFPEQISFVLKVEGLKDLAEEMAMSGFFNMTHEENTELFPEAEQEVLEDGSIKLTLRVDSKRIDGHRHLVILAPGAERLKQTSLLRAIQRSRQWTDMLINGEAGNVSDLAEKLGYKPSYVTRILSLNNLAPDIVESILAGTEPEGMSIAKITAQPIPEDWNEQRRLYGFPVR